ncbi:Nmd2p KNAG_0B04520 [Huiozyma naganishii CBS 8797]|uniref:MIF4G domain-containing protein n=1 Tax=Huiozyma naganishii (strain ATCC MYA-139 / BCRC 22969 / CBS 8797 / KCTC 17520 / NBRC 10181 / NCYC 3082 / Yp74L-3) TaxID=1071383 RepID=J7S4Y9_HUIN7|nr:hypothetical protein KNAG_0B04520 [Kazachstania naganishii CBS 8797]CCK68886.1 hypothetical protein KNAG_0B04520 [Kazachstania naganishii CBS 8797]
MYNERRIELHKLNSDAWVGVSVFEVDRNKLDSSIKRNTGFIKKLKKGITKENKDTLLKDIKEVFLEKYLSEVIVTVNEGLSLVPNKNDDISAAVEIICALHQRFYSNFTGKLFELFLQNFINPGDDELVLEKDELVRMKKIRSNFRILTELYLVGVFPSLDIAESKENVPLYLRKKVGKKEPFLVAILKELLNYKFKLGYTTLLATQLAKKYFTFFDDNDASWDLLIPDENLKVSLQAIYEVFVEAVFNKTVELDKKLAKLMKEHQKCQIRTGKAVDEYIEEYNLLLPVLQRFKEATEVFVECFNKEAPGLSSEKNLEDDEQPTSIITSQIVSPGQRLWETDEMKRFYENLPDIDVAIKASQERNVTKTDNNETVNHFFDELEIAETKEQIDRLSFEYWNSGIDNRATKNRLLKFFIEGQDWSKIKIYSRFLASNSKHFPDIVDEFIQYLDTGFRNQLHSNKINVKNVIFFSEMVKFMLVPSFVVFHKIRTLIMNLQVPNNIEILTIFFEHAGKFLLFKPEYKNEMDKMVQLLKLKMKDRQLGMNLKSALENTMVLLFPPSVKSLNVEDRELTDEEKFYHVLIRTELPNLKVKEHINLISRATWSDNNVRNTLHVLFTEPEKMNYQNIPILARVMTGLYPYRREFVIRVIDQLLENIERGLESNAHNQNMSRIAQVRLLTEIFNMEMIKSDVLVDTMYHIMKFGHKNNQPTPISASPLDLPNDYFRIQLLCTILLNITRFPVAFLKKLERLLRYFEYYTFCKKQPLPIETQFKVTDAFNNFSDRFNFEKSANIMECLTRLQSLAQAQSEQQRSLPMNSQCGLSANEMRNIIKTDVNVTQTDNEAYEDGEDEEEDDEPKYVDEMEEDADNQSGEKDDQGDEDENETDSDWDSNTSSEEDSDSESSSNENSDSEFKYMDVDRDIELKRMQEEYNKKLKSPEELKIEEELDKQFNIMLQESMEERKNEKPLVTAIPIMVNQNAATTPLLSDGTATNNQSLSNKVAFTFLTKAGKKTNTRTLDLPKDVKFVSGVLEEEEKLKNEREQIKKIVLQKTFD